MSLVIYAHNIHQGGGKTLLAGVLECLQGQHAIAYVDARLSCDIHGQDPKLVRIPPTFISRLVAEFRLKDSLLPTDTLLCLGNLPPLLARHPRTILFLQNRFLFGKRNLSAFPPETRVRIAVERLWLKWRLPSVGHVFVQTRTMQEEFKSETGRHARICPFMDFSSQKQSSSLSDSPKHDFLYVASGDPHKNHHNLVEAWKILAQEGIRPSLALTIDEKIYSKLWGQLVKIIKDGELAIRNYGHCASVQELYQQSTALIYPSTFESFGLPLLEASQHQLPILASELDFVRDSCDPAQTFDPNSPLSIARAVRRFLQSEEKRPTITTPRQFLEEIDRLEFP